MDRLRHQFPQVHHAVARLPDEEQRKVAQQAVAVALVTTGLDPHTTVTAADVQRLDEAAWDVQGRVEEGRAAESDYLAAFQRARAANAARLLVEDDDPQEALYEALHAVPAGFDEAWLRQG